MNADPIKSVVEGILKHIRFPDDWTVLAESSYNDETDTRVIVRRSLVLDGSALILGDINLSRRLREDVRDSLGHMTDAAFEQMNLDQRPNASPTTTVYYNRDCVLTVMSEPASGDKVPKRWSVHFVVSFDLPLKRLGEQFAAGNRP